jgi:predicted Rdx family selenoprotein
MNRKWVSQNIVAEKTDGVWRAWVAVELLEDNTLANEYSFVGIGKTRREAEESLRQRVRKLIRPERDFFKFGTRRYYRLRSFVQMVRAKRATVSETLTGYQEKRDVEVDNPAAG